MTSTRRNGFATHPLTAALALIACAAPAAFSGEDAAESAAPESVSPAVEFARRDLERAQQIVVSLREQADAAAAATELPAVGAAAATKQYLEALQKQRATALKAATTTADQRRAEQADAEKKSDAAKNDVATANESVAKSLKLRTNAEQTAALAATAVTLAEADLQAARDAKAEEVPARQVLVEAARTKLAATKAAIAAARKVETTAAAGLKTARAALVAAEQAAKTAAEGTATAVKQAAAARERHDAAAALVERAAKLLQDVTKEAQPAIDARKKTEEAVQAAETRVRKLADRVARFESQPPVADPAAIREVAKVTFERPPISVRLDPSGQHLLTGLQDKRLHRRDLLTGETAALEGHRTWIRRIALDPGGELLVTGDYSGSLAWWDPRTENPQPIRIAEDAESLQQLITDGECVVDCMLGTGATGEPRGLYGDAVRLANQRSGPRVAIDLPTGLDCDSGQPAETTFRADLTITFVGEKDGFGAAEAKPWIGNVEVVGIGVPKCLLDQFGVATT